MTAASEQQKAWKAYDPTTLIYPISVAFVMIG